MYKGFNLRNVGLCDLPAKRERVEAYVAIGEQAYNDNAATVRRSLRSFVRPGGTINGSELQKHWFPNVKAQVFISHSHESKTLAFALAGFVKSEFNLSPFVDSVVWGYAEELLREIDDRYCHDEERNVYDYRRRNESTSHVYAMLSNALAKMIDQTECLIFLNTPDSISSTEVVSKTKSPWIYSEIATAGIVRETPTGRRIPKIVLNESRRIHGEKRASSKGLNVEYVLDGLNRLTEITAITLGDWLGNYRDIRGHPLDTLYQTVAAEQVGI